MSYDTDNINLPQFITHFVFILLSTIIAAAWIQKCKILKSSFITIDNVL